MENYFSDTIEFLAETFFELEKLIENPEREPFHTSFRYTYKNKLPEQALVLKMARYISGLNAIGVLHQHGCVVEQAIIQRTLDEIHEDISFLAIGVCFDQITDLHVKFLDSFFATDGIPSIENQKKRWKKPDMVPRRKIRSWINSHEVSGYNPSDLNDTAENMSTGYSGFVHANAISCMEMYVGDPPSFRILGLHQTHRINEYGADAKNYLFRGIGCTAFVAMALGNEKLYERAREFQNEFVDTTGVGCRTTIISACPLTHQ